VKFSVVTVDDPEANAPERLSDAPVALLKLNVVTVVDAAESVPVMERPVPVAPRKPRLSVKRFVDVVFVPTAVVYVSDVALTFVLVTDVPTAVVYVSDVALIFVDVTFTDVMVVMLALDPVAPLNPRFDA
jgi:hypothetical protein